MKSFYHVLGIAILSSFISMNAWAVGGLRVNISTPNGALLPNNSTVALWYYVGNNTVLYRSQGTRLGLAPKTYTVKFKINSTLYQVPPDIAAPVQDNKITTLNILLKRN